MAKCRRKKRRKCGYSSPSMICVELTIGMEPILEKTMSLPLIDELRERINNNTWWGLFIDVYDEIDVRIRKSFGPILLERKNYEDSL